MTAKEGQGGPRRPGDGKEGQRRAMSRNLQRSLAVRVRYEGESGERGEGRGAPATAPGSQGEG